MTKPDTRPELVAGAKRFLAHWPDDTIEGAAVHTLLAHCAETEQRLAAAVEALDRTSRALKSAIRFNTAAERDEAFSAWLAARDLLPPADGGEHG